MRRKQEGQIGAFTFATRCQCRMAERRKANRCGASNCNQWEGGALQPQQSGRKRSCVSGTVMRPGLYEVDFGATLRDVLDQVEQRLLCPVQIVQHHYEWLYPRLLLEQLAEPPGDLLGRQLLARLGEHRSNRSSRVAFRQRPELRQDLHHGPVCDSVPVGETTAADRPREGAEEVLGSIKESVDDLRVKLDEVRAAARASTSSRRGPIRHTAATAPFTSRFRLL